MIKPEIKAINVHSDIWGDTPDDFYVKLEVDIGIEGINGSDLFMFSVISPKYLETSFSNHEILLGKGLLVTKDYNINAIENRINKILETCSKETWEQTAIEISKYCRWEFEGI